MQQPGLEWRHRAPSNSQQRTTLEIPFASLDCIFEMQKAMVGAYQRWDSFCPAEGRFEPIQSISLPSLQERVWTAENLMKLSEEVRRSSKLKELGETLLEHNSASVARLLLQWRGEAQRMLPPLNAPTLESSNDNSSPDDIGVSVHPGEDQVRSIVDMVSACCWLVKLLYETLDSPQNRTRWSSASRRVVWNMGTHSRRTVSSIAMLCLCMCGHVLEQLEASNPVGSAALSAVIDCLSRAAGVATRRSSLVILRTIWWGLFHTTDSGLKKKRGIPMFRHRGDAFEEDLLRLRDSLNPLTGRFVTAIASDQSRSLIATRFQNAKFLSLYAERRFTRYLLAHGLAFSEDGFLEVARKMQLPELTRISFHFARIPKPTDLDMALVTALVTRIHSFPFAGGQPLIRAFFAPNRGFARMRSQFFPIMKKVFPPATIHSLLPDARHMLCLCLLQGDLGSAFALVEFGATSFEEPCDRCDETIFPGIVSKLFDLNRSRTHASPIFLLWMLHQQGILPILVARSSQRDMRAILDSVGQACGPEYRRIVSGWFGDRDEALGKRNSGKVVEVELYSTDSDGTFHLWNLPEDVFTNICGRLELNEIFRLAAVCRDLRHFLLGNSRLWTSIAQRSTAFCCHRASLELLRASEIDARQAVIATSKARIELCRSDPALSATRPCGDDWETSERISNSRRTFTRPHSNEVFLPVWYSEFSIPGVYDEVLEGDRYRAVIDSTQGDLVIVDSDLEIDTTVAPIRGGMRNRTMVAETIKRALRSVGRKVTAISSPPDAYTARIHRDTFLVSGTLSASRSVTNSASSVGSIINFDDLEVARFSLNSEAGSSWLAVRNFSLGSRDNFGPASTSFVIQSFSKNFSNGKYVGTFALLDHRSLQRVWSAGESHSYDFYPGPRDSHTLSAAVDFPYLISTVPTSHFSSDLFVFDIRRGDKALEKRRGLTGAHFHNSTVFCSRFPNPDVVRIPVWETMRFDSSRAPILEETGVAMAMQDSSFVLLRALGANCSGLSLGKLTSSSNHAQNKLMFDHLGFLYG